MLNDTQIIELTRDLDQVFKRYGIEQWQTLFIEDPTPEGKRPVGILHGPNNSLGSRLFYDKISEMVWGFGPKIQEMNFKLTKK